MLQPQAYVPTGPERCIREYPLETVDEQVLEMPCAQMLSVGEQAGKLVVWASVQPGARVQHYRFRIFGTGHPLGQVHPGNYLGTVQSYVGELVWHVFWSCV